jgi:hypothetical protein
VVSRLKTASGADIDEPVCVRSIVETLAPQVLWKGLDKAVQRERKHIK